MQELRTPKRRSPGFCLRKMLERTPGQEFTARECLGIYRGMTTALIFIAGICFAWQIIEEVWRYGMDVNDHADRLFDE